MEVKQVLNTVISKTASCLGLSKEEVERKAIEQLIREELRRIRAEKAVILYKYGVNNFKELITLVEKDIVSDVDAHDDIVKLDHLEYREKTLTKLLKEIEELSIE